MSFYSGQKIVCVDNSPVTNSCYNDSLKRLSIGKIYTVIHFHDDDVLLKEVKSSHPSGEFRAAKRFIPLLTDSIEYAEKLLNEITIEINEQNLVEK